jgi:hypothetical protein
MSIEHQNLTIPPVAEVHGTQPKVIRASDLARMVVCEQRMVFEHVHGRRERHFQAEARRKGIRAHQAYFQEAQQLINERPWHWALRGLKSFITRLVCVLPWWRSKRKNSNGKIASLARKKTGDVMDASLPAGTKTGTVR